MGVDMHSNLPTVDTEGGKVRAVPFHRLKERNIPQQAEEGLIYAVYKRKPLWDPSVHFYRNNTVIKILWEEVANETGLSDTQAKGRWKSLRDYYRLELKKIQRSGEEPKKSNWAHFNSMSFLQELMAPKKNDAADGDLLMAEESQSSVEEVEQPADTEDVYIRDEETRPPRWRPLNVDSTSGSVVQEPPSQPMNSLKMRQNHGEMYRKVLIDLERRRLDLLERNSQMEQDDDMQYLKSMLPLIKMLPLSRKIGVRLKFQEIICREIEELERSNAAAILISLAFIKGRWESGENSEDKKITSDIVFSDFEVIAKECPEGKN